MGEGSQEKQVDGHSLALLVAWKALLVAWENC